MKRRQFGWRWRRGNRRISRMDGSVKFRRRAGIAVAILIALTGIAIGTPGLTDGRSNGGPPAGKSSVPFWIEGKSLHFDDSFNPAFDTVENGRFVQDLGSGYKAIYTLDPVVQQRLEKVFADNRVPYGAAVAIEAKSGRVLAMAEYSRSEPGVKGLTTRATYPAASIFKLVTAAAALEEKKVTPQTTIHFHGGLYALGPRNWIDNPRRDRLSITVADALAKSCNVAFAKIALHHLSAQDLLTYSSLLGFNREIDFELPIQPSRAEISDTPASIARSAAGMGRVGLSPLHAAVMTAAIANDGVMMTPYFVDRIMGPDGAVVYAAEARAMGRSLSVGTAGTLRTMMANTILRGTSRHAFMSRRGAPYLRGVPIGGKTGSLTGDDPPGKYAWFVGIAPLDDPEIAVSALVINRGRWRIKGSAVGREAFNAYFKSLDVQADSGVLLHR